MNRDQIRFLATGIVFGFVVGYVIAYALHEPRVKLVAAPVPAAGNLGMTPIVGSSPPPQAGGPAPGAEHGEEIMARVFAEIDALKSTIEKDPENADVLTRLGNLYHDSGKFEEAIEYYRRVLEIRPDDVNVSTDLGICLRVVGKIDAAIAQFRQSLSRDPHHWQTWLNLGIVSLFDQNDTETAAEAFAQLEKHNPGFKDLPLLKEAVLKAKAASPR